jgi:hypothetical protein
MGSPSHKRRQRGRSDMMASGRLGIHITAVGLLFPSTQVCDPSIQVLNSKGLNQSSEPIARRPKSYQEIL